MSKKELSQSDKDLAEELAYGIYLWDSPIWMILVLLLLIFLSNSTPRVLEILLILVPLWLYYAYNITNTRTNKIEELCMESLENNIKHSKLLKLKTNRRSSTINNIKEKFLDFQDISQTSTNNSNNSDIKNVGIIFYVLLIVYVLIAIVPSSSENSNTSNVEVPENNNDQNNNNNANEELEAEVVPMGDGLTSFTIINRNDFDWENIEVTVNDYYICSDFQNSIMSGEQVTFIAERCDEFVSNGNIVVNKLEIETNEGNAQFERR